MNWCPYLLPIPALDDTGNSLSPSVEQLDRNLNASYFTGIFFYFLSIVCPFISIIFIYCLSDVYPKILFCRDGVSEGQFYQVLLHELDAIRKVRGYACVDMHLQDDLRYTASLGI